MTKVNINTFLMYLIFFTCIYQQDVYAESPVGDDNPKKQDVTDIGESDRFSVHAQSTYIWQQKNNFNSPYYGTNSLTNKAEGGGALSYTFSATGFFGARLWEGAEAYYNPEMFEGRPFTGALVGLGGFQNGELQLGSFVPATYYNARAYIKQTFNLGGSTIHFESAQNQIAGDVKSNRVVLIYGKVASLDYFDQNQYSHDPRTQFQNFALWSMGAYGYAADSKGYTYGVVGEWYQDSFVYRAARLAVPNEPGTIGLDRTLRQNYVDTFETSYSHSSWGQSGVIRGLIYRQYANMATFNNAIAAANTLNAGLSQSDAAYNSSPITSSRSLTHSWGYGINLEQSLNDYIGLFGRWSWNPGQTETLAQDINRSLSFGTSIAGNAWGRADDTFGLGFAINGISASQINYLSKGYYTLYVGDGQLQYRNEQITETYYSAQICKGLSLTGNFQRILNPAYNQNRGPINFFGFRIHAEI